MKRIIAPSSNTMRLANGTVWSIPITLAVEAEKAAELTVGQRAALVGEDGVIYAIIDIESIYNVDQKYEARNVFKTDEEEHPGVAKLYEPPFHICRRTDYGAESAGAGEIQ